MCTPTEVKDLLARFCQECPDAALGMMDGLSDDAKLFVSFHANPTFCAAVTETSWQLCQAATN